MALLDPFLAAAEAIWDKYRMYQRVYHLAGRLSHLTLQLSRWIWRVGIEKTEPVAAVVSVLALAAAFVLQGACEVVFLNEVAYLAREVKEARHLWWRL